MTMQNYRNLPSGTVDRARELRRKRTDAENKLWYALRERLPGHKWRFQVPFHPYYADFACLAAKLIIEVDGGQHDENRAEDERRTRFLEARGYRVLRFWNNDVLNNIDGVLATTAQSLSHREREGAAKPRKGEGDHLTTTTSPSPSHADAWPLPLPVGEGKLEPDPCPS
jgi:very-short-patch-repair endonuclease